MSAASPPGSWWIVAGNERGIDHVQVQVDEDGRAVERVLGVDERLERGADHGDAVALEQLALAVVERADAGEHDLLGVDRAAEPRIPHAAGARQRHAAEVAARRGVGRVEVPVRVEPEHSCARPLTQRRQGASSGRSCTRPTAAPGRCRPSSASSTCPPASSRQPRESREVVGPVAHARLAGLADRARLAAQSLAHQRSQRLHPARPAARPVGGAAVVGHERDAHRPVQFGSRFSKNAFTPSVDVLGRQRDRELRAQVLERVERTPCPAGGTSRPCPGA